ncbi:MAG TPA: hypothetical protein VMW06_04330, partial [Desulfobacterales bacterium]|nr:hypothetical protein [Desulfobacterales bacterium]
HLYQGEIKISTLFFFYQEMGVLGGGGFYRACWAGARSVAVVFFPIILCAPFSRVFHTGLVGESIRNTKRDTINRLNFTADMFEIFLMECYTVE